MKQFTGLVLFVVGVSAAMFVAGVVLFPPLLTFGTVLVNWMNSN